VRYARINGDSLPSVGAITSAYFTYDASLFSDCAYTVGTKFAVEGLTPTATYPY